MNKPELEDKRRSATSAPDTRNSQHRGSTSERGSNINGVPYRAGPSPLNHSLSAKFNLNGSYAGPKGKVNKDRFKRTPKSTAEIGGCNLDIMEEGESNSVLYDPEKELLLQLVDPLQSCSRQRLRSVQMALRKHGKEGLRVTAKELYVILQENEIQVPNRNFQMMCELYEDTVGIDYERLWRLLVEAQSHTGRDSVVQLSTQSDFSRRQNYMSRDKRDEDLIRRLKEQLLRSHDPLDLHQLRASFQVRDKNKIGRIDVKDVSLACNAVRLPIYGTLLRALINRCNDVNTGLISWPEIISFLEKAERMMNVNNNVNESIFSTSKKPTSVSPSSKPVKSKTTACTTRPSTGQSTPSTPRPNTSQNTTSASKSSTSQSNPITKTSPQPTKRPPTAHAPNKSKPTPNVSQNSDRPQASADSSNSSKHCQSAHKRKVTPPNENKQSVNDSKQTYSATKQNIPKSVNQKEVQDSKTQEGVNKDVKKNDTTSTKSDPPTIKVAKDSIKESTKSDETNSQETIKNEHKATDDGQEKIGHINDKTIGDTKPIVPVIQVDPVIDQPQDDTSPPNSIETASNPKPDLLLDVGHGETGHLSARHTNAIKLEIRGKTFTFWPPDEYRQNNPEPPQERLQLEWVYGYRGNDCRSNLYLLASDEIVYFIGCVVVIYDATSHMQRHYREHTHEIKCIAVHSDRSMVATGQNSSSEQSDAHIRVWRADTLETVHVLGMGYFHKAVTSLSFSREKDLLATIDHGDDYKLSVWDARNGAHVCQCKMDTDVVCDIGFNPVSSDIIVSVGKEHLSWWRVYPEAKTVDLHAKPDYENNLRARFVISLTHNDKGDLITGDSNGTIYVWGQGNNVITNFIKHAHEGPVFSLLLVRNYLLTAARDGLVKAWVCNKTMDAAGDIKIPSSEGAVRMLQRFHDKLLLGTTTNSILTVAISLSSSPLVGAVISKQFLSQGHFDNVCDLAVPPNSFGCPWFVSVGYDGIVSMNNAAAKQPVWKHTMKNCCISAVDVSREGTLVTLATKDCRLIILTVACEQTDEEKHYDVKEDTTLTVGNSKLTSIKIAADNRTIALGNVNGYITMITLTEEEGAHSWEIGKQIKGHEHAIQTLTWSATKYGNDDIIQSTSSDLQLMFWNARTMSPVDAFLLRNMRWLTSQTPLSLQVAGIWSSKQAQEADVSAVQVNPSRSLVAIGHSHGYLSLFKSPCCHRGAFSHTYLSHRAVQGLTFTSDGRFLISVGGLDCCIMQWKIV